MGPRVADLVFRDVSAFEHLERGTGCDVTGREPIRAGLAPVAGRPWALAEWEMSCVQAAKIRLKFGSSFPGLIETVLTSTTVVGFSIGKWSALAH